MYSYVYIFKFSLKFFPSILLSAWDSIRYLRRFHAAKNHRNTETLSFDNVSSEGYRKSWMKTRIKEGWKSDRSRVENIPMKELLSTVDFRPRDNSSSHNADELKERWNFRRKADCQPFLPDPTWKETIFLDYTFIHSARSSGFFVQGYLAQLSANCFPPSCSILHSYVVWGFIKFSGWSLALSIARSKVNHWTTCQRDFTRRIGINVQGWIGIFFARFIVVQILLVF